MAFVWRWGFQCSNLGGSKILHDPPGPSPNMGNPGHKGWRWRWDSPTTRQQRRLARPPRQPENLDEKRWTRNSLRKKRLWISTKNRRFLVRSFIKYFRLFTDLVQNISKKKSKDFEYQRLQNPNSSYIFGNKTYQSAKPHALVPVRRITNATLRRRRAQDRIQHVSHAQVKFTALPSVSSGNNDRMQNHTWNGILQSENGAFSWIFGCSIENTLPVDIGALAENFEWTPWHADPPAKSAWIEVPRASRPWANASGKAILNHWGLVNLQREPIWQSELPLEIFNKNAWQPPMVSHFHAGVLGSSIGFSQQRRQQSCASTKQCLGMVITCCLRIGFWTYIGIGETWHCWRKFAANDSLLCSLCAVLLLVPTKSMEFLQLQLAGAKRLISLVKTGCSSVPWTMNVTSPKTK